MEMRGEMEEMIATSPLETLFEVRSRPQSARDCGAACLSMVYRALGKKVPPAEIWPEVAKKNQFGSIASTTHLMTQDALNRGFAAVAFQAKHPLLSLRRCRDLDIQAILNLRLRHDAPTGHYAVLADIDARNVVLNDPFYGPSFILSHAEVLELWQPHFPNSEIVGYMLMGVAPHASEAQTCELCRTPVPLGAECPRCKQVVGLEPGVLLGCVNSDCIARAWNYVCCPSCDYTWDLTFPSNPAGAAADISPSPSADPPAASKAAAGLDVNKLFGELDKFSAFLLGMPAAAGHPEIRKQLDFITTCKERLKPAVAELLGSREARRAQMASLVQAAKAQGEAYQQEEMKKMTKPAPPSPPLDGYALARALLKNLGWEA
jgi:hypothetical protein